MQFPFSFVAFFFSYWLLLAEEEAAQLRIGSWVGEAEHGSLGRGLPPLIDLIERCAADRGLLIGWTRRPHRHLHGRHTGSVSRQTADTDSR